LQSYQEQFIHYAIECDVLRFGEFTLKSGRVSPYFFNTGMFDTGARIGKLGEFYAEAMINQTLNPDVIYGPAYKGITLACATAIALAKKTGKEVPFCFNRKEAKDHGEGGSIVGTKLQGSVLIIDDVITAGTSVRESVEIIQSEGAKAGGVLIALDRQEKGTGSLTAVEEVSKNFSLPVHSIVSLENILQYLEANGRQRELDTIRKYHSGNE
jgi:orotate phosphoribosyltransferase